MKYNIVLYDSAAGQWKDRGFDKLGQLIKFIIPLIKEMKPFTRTTVGCELKITKTRDEL